MGRQRRPSARIERARASPSSAAMTGTPTKTSATVPPTQTAAASRCTATSTDSTADTLARMPFPKIELHVHFEGTVRPATLLELAERNDYASPPTDYDFHDFACFVQQFELTAGALQHADDFRRIVVEYAE